MGVCLSGESNMFENNHELTLFSQPAVNPGQEWVELSVNNQSDLVQSPLKYVHLT